MSGKTISAPAPASSADEVARLAALGRDLSIRAGEADKAHDRAVQAFDRGEGSAEDVARAEALRNVAEGACQRNARLLAAARATADAEAREEARNARLAGLADRANRCAALASEAERAMRAVRDALREGIGEARAAIERHDEARRDFWRAASVDFPAAAEPRSHTRRMPDDASEQGAGLLVLLRELGADESGFRKRYNWNRSDPGAVLDTSWDVGLSDSRPLDAEVGRLVHAAHKLNL